MTMSFHAILERYRQHSFSERDKGDRFERLMQGDSVIFLGYYFD